MTRHKCVSFPDTFLEFCSFIEQSKCLPKGYVNSPFHGPLTRVWECMKERGAKSLLLQDRVRDPDFFAEHHAYYLKQHRYVSPLCARIHAFRTEVCEDEDPLRLIDLAEQEAHSYIGFTTVRPLISAPVAATILEADASHYSVPCSDKFPVHIAGQTFHVIGTPFLQQDNSVGACAQASMWMALRTQRRRTGNSAFNTAELTLAATRYLMEDRVFPGRNGLTVGQMLQAIQFAGHDPCVVPIPSRRNADWPAFSNYSPADLDHVRAAIEPYVISGLPVILCMIRPDGEGHAVTAIGRRVDGLPAATAPNVLISSALGMETLVVHNDGQGPYVELARRAVGSADGWALDDIASIIVPFPNGVIATAAEANALAHDWFRRLLEPLAAGMKVPLNLRDGIVVRQFLMERHAFRRHMHKDDMGAETLKKFGRTIDLPTWVWVAEFHLQQELADSKPSRVGLFVIDATSDVETSRPLVSHLNGAVFDETQSGLGFTVTAQTVEALPVEPKFYISYDDHLALPISPPAHV
ncbi:hypothetical protein QFZ83_006405 [Variovorax sp. W1I1]|uniref:hypothetical protein n=1 Tax=Variovorax sp. W1I1 TaxID=3042309 RepID=UPI0027887694|nr:hypothetical protein [Variovorax sp. W1I1]MDQ0612234.1 hypothetical protein [Variovorax sp. W1I1]